MSIFRFYQREYEEYKVRVNALVAKAQKTPDEGWTMQDGTSWPGNNSRDHPGMIQVYLFILFEIKSQWWEAQSISQIPSLCNLAIELLKGPNIVDVCDIIIINWLYRANCILRADTVLHRFSFHFNICYHCQVFLGHSGAHDIEGNELPRLVYVSREKRPGYQHHKKAGAENALVRSIDT